jgi:CRISPR-associated protein Cas6
MYWEEGKQEQILTVPDDVVDISYRIQCRALPVDHAEALAEALLAKLDWLAADPQAGVHSIHVADSGNGWMRPDSPNDLIYPSRRTRLTLRVPQARVDEALQLPGTVLDVAGNSLEIGEASVRPLSTLTTLFARYVVAEDGGDEGVFLESMATELGDLGIRPRKMMCGISKTIRYGDAKIRTRSLMLADLSVDDSIRLQQQGLGPYRHLGCGLFIPHKDIKQVRAAASTETK